MCIDRPQTHQEMPDTAGLLWLLSLSPQGTVLNLSTVTAEAVALAVGPQCGECALSLTSRGAAGTSIPAHLASYKS